MAIEKRAFLYHAKDYGDGHDSEHIPLAKYLSRGERGRGKLIDLIGTLIDE